MEEKPLEYLIDAQARAMLDEMKHSDPGQKVRLSQAVANLAKAKQELKGGVDTNQSLSALIKKIQRNNEND